MASAPVPFPFARSPRAPKAPRAVVRRAAAAVRTAAVRTAAVEALEDRRLLSVSLISVAPDGVTPGNGASGEASVSQDGRYVVFSSTSTNLVAGDANGKTDIFLRDRQTNTTVLVSKNPSTGAQGNDDSFAPVISSDGNFVAFASKANTLLPGEQDPAGTTGKVFRYNVQTQALELVSARPSGAVSGANSGEPSISADGRFVAFTSFAETFGPADNNRANDVYVRDMNGTTVQLVSVKTGGGGAGDKASFDSNISADGRFVTFRSDATNLVANDTNAARDAFIRDLQSGTTTRVSVNTAGNGGNAASDANAVSGNGVFVAFQSQASDLVTTPADTNSLSDIFLRNTSTNATTLLTVNRQGTASARGASRFPWLSIDGRFATFSSTAPDLVPGDVNSKEDVFLRDVQTGVITALSVTPAGATGNGSSFDTYVTNSGRFAVFTSDASDLVAGDGNNKADIFLATAPDLTTDTTAPTVTVSATQPGVSAGDTEITFTVDLADETGLNTVTVGGLLVSKNGGAPVTATLKGVVGSGKTAVATYSIPITAPGGAASQDNGTYTVSVPAGAIKDAAGNNAAGITGNNAFAVNVGLANGPDLVPTVLGKLPAAVIGGNKKGKISVKVANTGQTVLTKKPVTVTLFLSDDQAIGGDTQVSQQTKTLSLKVGKSKTLKFKFTYPLTIGNGNFFVLAQVDPANTVAESNERNNSASSATAVAVTQPFIDLQPTNATNPAGTLHAGGNATVNVTIKNNGNVAIKKAVAVSVAASTDQTPDPTDRVLATPTRTIKLNPGKSTTLKVPFTFPSDLAAGSYFVTAQVDPTNAIVETDDLNNTFVGATTFVVS